MSFTIYLVRHGIARAASAQVSDADRALTPEGARKVTRAAVGLKRLGVVPTAVLSSPLRRARETADLLANVLLPDSAVEIYPPLAPGQRAGNVLAGLAAYRSAHVLVLVGHEPGMGKLASHLLTGSASLLRFDFKKGAVAAIEISSFAAPSRGNLLWFLTAKQLRLVGRAHRLVPL